MNSMWSIIQLASKLENSYSWNGVIFYLQKITSKLKDTTTINLKEETKRNNKPKNWKVSATDGNFGRQTKAGQFYSYWSQGTCIRIWEIELSKC